MWEKGYRTFLITMCSPGNEVGDPSIWEDWEALDMEHPNKPTSDPNLEGASVSAVSCTRNRYNQSSESKKPRKRLLGMSRRVYWG